MTDYISRADAIDAVKSLPNTPNGFSDTYSKSCIIEILEEIPSADAEPKWNCTANFVAEQLDRLRNMTDEEKWNFFIKFFSPSSDALLKQEIDFHKEVSRIEAEKVVDLEHKLADAVPTVIRAKTFMRKEDFDKWAEDIKKQNKSIVCIPCDAEVVSADAVQGWIPLNKQKSFLMMPDELVAVNVTWVNHLAPPYYKHIEDVPFVDTAVYYRGKWYWWNATVIDVLAEYGEDCNAEQIDKDIEILAWQPLPTPYKGGDSE